VEGTRVGEVLGIWQLDDFVGSGGMGDVYRAHRIDNVVQQIAAVKIQRRPHTGYVPDEADLLRSLAHPYIARWFDDGWTPEGQRYLVMEYVEGLPITDFADQQGLSIHGRLEIFLRACAAVEYAHHRLVVHMDLKPGNILVNNEGTIKIVDFGIARRLGAGDDPTAAFSGPYASPEQVQQAPRSGYPADIYALGAVLYELLCGHTPFNPLLKAAELERQIIEETPRRPSWAISQTRLRHDKRGGYLRLDPDGIARMRGGCRLSEARKLLAGDLDAICLFALRKEPLRRYRSVDDLISDIRSTTEGRTPSVARSDSLWYSALRTARRRPALVLLVVAFVELLASETHDPQEMITSGRASIESRIRIEQTANSVLGELKNTLRPQLAGDSRLRAAMEALDAAIQVASEPAGAGAGDPRKRHTQGASQAPDAQDTPK
jgi:serine/threonine protein kinase